MSVRGSMVVACNFLVMAVLFAMPIAAAAQSSTITLNIPQFGAEGGTLAAGGVVSTVGTNHPPLTVNLFSSNTNRLQLAPFVVIPAGTNSARFDLVLPDNDWIEGTENLFVEAWLQDVFSDLDSIRVSDNESAGLAVALTGPIIEGNRTLTNAGRISFSGRSITNVIVALQSDHPELISVPPLVTNLAGQSNSTFNVVVGSDNITNGVSFVRISASAIGFFGATNMVGWLDDEVLIPVNPLPANGAVQVASTTLLKWKTDSNAPPGTTYDVYLGTSYIGGSREYLGTTSESMWTPPLLAAGVTYYWQIVARNDITVPGPLWSFTTRGLDRFEFGTIGRQFRNTPFPVTISARDELNRLMTNFSGSAALSATIVSILSNTMLPSPEHFSSATLPSFSMGYSFTPSVDIRVRAVRHYFGTKVSIWTDAGALIVAQPVTSTEGIWLETPLAAPLTLTAGTRYRLTTHGQGTIYSQDRLINFSHGTIGVTWLTNSDVFPNTFSDASITALVDLRYEIDHSAPGTIDIASTGPFTNGQWAGTLRSLQVATNLVLRASDGAGRFGLSNPFNVFSNLPPLITNQPAGLSTHTGTNATFSVGVRDAIAQIYRWRRNGVNLVDGDRISGAHSPTLTIAGLREEDAGMYVVMVTNPFGTVVSSNAALAVRALHHFSWSVIPSVQIIDVPFTATVEARDFFDRVVTNFADFVAFRGMSNGSVVVTPADAVEFTNGVWSGLITVPGTNSNLTLRAFYYDISSPSNPFYVLSSNQPPVFLAMPANQFVRPGSNATLAVEAISPTPLQYQWLRSGTNISDSARFHGVTSSVLNIENFQSSDAGTYSVLVSNEFGSATSTNFTLTLDLLDHFDLSILGVTHKFISQSFTVLVQAMSSSNQPVANCPGPSVWSGVGDGGVTVTPIVAGDVPGILTNSVWTGQVIIMKPVTNLVLRVDDGTGRFGLSPPFHVGPNNQGPVLIMAPTNQVVRVGDTARFFALAYGGSLVYSWNTNNVAIQNGGRFSGQGTTTLTISNVVESDAKIYSVRMANGLGPAILTNARLSVYRQDHFTWSPVPSPQSIYRPVTVSLQARGPSNVLVTNFTETVSLSAAEAGTGTPVLISPVTSSKFIAGVWNGTIAIAEAVSNVVLRAEDAIGNVGYSAPFSVEHLVAFTLQPTNQLVLPGTNVTLVAAAVGTGAVRYQWRFEGTNIPNATSASFSFNNVSVTNYHGTFSCVASDDLGTTAVSSNAFIYVLVKPGVVTHLQSTSVLQGGTAILSLVATGAPPLGYSWVRNSVFYTNTSVPFLMLSNVQATANFRAFVTNLANSSGAFSPGPAQVDNVTLTMLADADGDGIPDAWESQYGLSSTNAIDALLDADSDGLSNRDEYLAGTNPTDAASVLKISLTATNASQLQFIAQSNIAYAVEYRTALSSESWTNLTSLLAQPLVRTVQVNVPNPPPESKRFYRIVTPPVP